MPYISHCGAGREDMILQTFLLQSNGSRPQISFGRAEMLTAVPAPDEASAASRLPPHCPQRQLPGANCAAGCALAAACWLRAAGCPILCRLRAVLSPLASGERKPALPLFLFESKTTAPGTRKPSSVPCKSPPRLLARPPCVACAAPRARRIPALRRRRRAVENRARLVRQATTAAPASHGKARARCANARRAHVDRRPVSASCGWVPSH